MAGQEEVLVSLWQRDLRGKGSKCQGVEPLEQRAHPTIGLPAYRGASVTVCGECWWVGGLEATGHRHLRSGPQCRSELTVFLILPLYLIKVLHTVNPAASHLRGHGMGEACAL